jgi:hypothetical protein
MSTRLRGVLYHGKLPVPYVAAWSSETGIAIRTDVLAGHRPAIYRTGERGKGVPMFGKMDESRVRRVIIERLCQVCARPLGDTGYVVDSIKGEMDRRPLLSEPLSCLRCFNVALALCPGIARMKGGARTIGIRCRTYDAVLATVRKFEGDNGDPVLNAALDAWTGAPPVGYAKYVPNDYAVMNTFCAHATSTMFVPSQPTEDV